ncbi:hypothetical protein CCR75_006168 [Bremia lactucae]|uniref:Uncharacterized protein n=1 Tax=Bremia lactucae TaxID=4779 RepID=A0A976IKB9_BRELC|nr:hypothetical protein CCR75_006168 [Bremia lactucae]
MDGATTDYPLIPYGSIKLVCIRVSFLHQAAANRSYAQKKRTIMRVTICGKLLETAMPIVLFALFTGDNPRDFLGWEWHNPAISRLLAITSME